MHKQTNYLIHWINDRSWNYHSLLIYILRSFSRPLTLSFTLFIIKEDNAKKCKHEQKQTDCFTRGSNSRVKLHWEVIFFIFFSFCFAFNTFHWNISISACWHKAFTCYNITYILNKKHSENAKTFTSLIKTNKIR